MRRKKVMLAAEAAASVLAVALALAPAVESADAYFTTYTGASGGRVLSVGSQPDIEETFSGWTKTVTVSNSEDSQPVYVRVRGFGSSHTLNYQDDSGKWSAGGDGFYYYGEIVNPGETADPIRIGIGDIPEGENSFNVAVIYETTPVQYMPDGTPYADWEVQLETLGTETGSPDAVDG